MNGETCRKSLRTPVSSKKWHDSTNNVITNTVTSKGWYDKSRHIFWFIMDEDSMTVMIFWDWSKHRLEQARAPYYHQTKKNQVVVG